MLLASSCVWLWGFFIINETVFFSIGISLVLRLGIAIKMDVSSMILPPPSSFPMYKTVVITT